MLVLKQKNYAANGKQLLQTMRRFMSTADISKHQIDLFSKEKKRQQESVGRVDKIEVRYLGLPNETTLVMNKHISTPYNCAQHFSETHCNRSALALLDNSTLWDMHRPLTESCTLQLLDFHMAEPHAVNKAFWRSCSFLLGAALKNAFQENANLHLHSFPTPNIRSGSFVYDFALGQGGWKPTKQEMRTFSAEMIKLAAKDLKIERLDIHHDLALEMFEHNPFKREQLPSISNQSNGIITVYRVGDHVDISRGPMVGSTGMLGKCTIAAIHEIPLLDLQGTFFYRAQGVALPIGLNLNHFAFGILEERARKLNTARLPTEQFEVNPSEASASV